MAMTAQVKAELANTQITKTCCRKAEVSTTLRFAGGLHIVSGKIVVEAELDTGAIGHVAGDWRGRLRVQAFGLAVA